MVIHVHICQQLRCEIISWEEVPYYMYAETVKYRLCNNDLRCLSYSFTQHILHPFFRSIGQSIYTCTVSMFDVAVQQRCCTVPFSRLYQKFDVQLIHCCRFIYSNSFVLQLYNQLSTTECIAGQSTTVLLLYVIVNVWVYMRYGKYHEGIMIVPEERAIILPEGYFSQHVHAHTLTNLLLGKP